MSGSVLVLCVVNVNENENVSDEVVGKGRERRGKVRKGRRKGKECGVMRVREWSECEFWMRV